MKQPCDEAVIRAGALSAPCAERSRPWVLAATVLAVAVLGVVMAAAFAQSLRHSPDGLHLNAGVVQQLESTVAKLDSFGAPSGVDSQTASTIRSAIAESFIFGFRLIMLLCAGLAIASAAVAWRRIPAESAPRVPDLGDVAAPQ